MNPISTSFWLAEPHRELIAAIDRKRDVNSPSEPFRGLTVVRVATARDRSSLENLSALDLTETPGRATLLGELRERPVAAPPLSDRKVIARSVRRDKRHRRTPARTRPGIAPRTLALVVPQTCRPRATRLRAARTRDRSRWPLAVSPKHGTPAGLPGNANEVRRV